MHGEELDSSRDGGGKTSLLRVGKGRYFIEGNQILSQLYFQP
jgi:hypothetical protein